MNKDNKHYSIDQYHKNTNIVEAKEGERTRLVFNVYANAKDNYKVNQPLVEVMIDTEYKKRSVSAHGTIKLSPDDCRDLARKLMLMADVSEGNLE